MSNDNYHEQFQPQLEIVEIEQDSDHAKLMRAYRRLNQKIDSLIEKRKAPKEDATRQP